ncbi:hypothetical protein [Szabonella alba]|uniref:Uncharacterized protein n=1 Tax=Szabonella alba TaxID=2804194 RepID=A0A8K0VAM8_9RHOB|nr:hypothetical protein [Szabonella alba]MBL4918714.1 hypothetical protein [Szabonella alba]
MYVDKKHKIGKNEKLDSVIKKYGHKDWKIIWKDKANASLVSKRKEPENLQPGDVVIIPPNAKQAQEIAEYIFKLNESLVAERAFVDSCNGFEQRFTRMAAQNRKYADELADEYGDMIHKIKLTNSSTKRTSDGVDVAADIALLFVAIGKLGQASSKAAKSSGAELKKINDDAAKDAMAFAASPVEKVIVSACGKFLSDAKAGRSYTALFVGDLVTASANLTKPSFWGKTIVKLHDGASWSEAVTADLSKDLDKAIEKLERDRDAAVRGFLTTAKSLEQRAVEMKKAAKNAGSHIKKLERELSDLES